MKSAMLEAIYRKEIGKARERVAKDVNLLFPEILCWSLPVFWDPPRIDGKWEVGHINSDWFRVRTLEYTPKYYQEVEKIVKTRFAQIGLSCKVNFSADGMKFSVADVVRMG